MGITLFAAVGCLFTLVCLYGGSQGYAMSYAAITLLFCFLAGTIEKGGKRCANQRRLLK